MTFEKINKGLQNKTFTKLQINNNMLIYNKIQYSFFQIFFIFYTIQSSSFMQNQDNAEKAFFQQLKPGDFVDARYGDDDWKVAKVIDRQNKYLTIVFDGMSNNNQQLYINPFRVKPLRAVTVGYTGPMKGVYSSISSISDLSKLIQMLDTILKSKELSSAYKLTQFLRGELFTIVNSLLMSDLRFGLQELQQINKFLLQLVDRICKICLKAKQYLNQYWQASSNNKFLYLLNSKIAIISSLSELLQLINLSISQGNQMPRLIKNNQNKISQLNLINNLKAHLPLLAQLCASNDSNGKWLPTFTRITISKILIKSKEEDKFLKIQYDIRDYLEYYSYWIHIINMIPSNENEHKLLQYIQNVMCKQSPFDAKLKSLALLRRILEKEIKLSFFSVQDVGKEINSKAIVDSLLKSFNPEIFKRYIPILKVIAQYNKKPLAQNQIDDLFKIMKTSHQSDVNLIFEIIVNISQFVGVDILDNIYSDIEKNIDINSENSLKFIRDFTIKAIQNFNNSKNKGFLNIFGKKKCSNKYGYYGLNLFWKQIQDQQGKIIANNVPLVINNISFIFENQSFHHERYPSMQKCLVNINKKQNYGQSVKLLHQIISTYPINSLIGDKQSSVIGKLDEKYKLVDCLIQPLKSLQKENTKAIQYGITRLKVNFETSIKYCYNFLQQYSNFFKTPIQLRHINSLWNMPFVFDFLRKSIDSNDPELPAYKRKYLKKLNSELIKGIITQILSNNDSIITTQQCFQSMHELIVSFNLNKSIQLTQGGTIRYKNLDGIIGIKFYFNFLGKILYLIKSNQKKNIKCERNVDLFKKVIKIIFEIHLRPQQYYKVEAKCKNWINCLMKIINITYKENVEFCVYAIQLFLQLIKGRLSKDISAFGKLDIIIGYDNRQKTISLPKNSTIFKLRLSIMEAFKIKTNFDMFSIPMKREIKFTQEEDFSINALQLARGATILIRRVQQSEKFPLIDSYEKFMSLIQEEEEFYRIIFSLLQAKIDTSLQGRIWKIIEKIPVNKAIKEKIENCKQFSKKDWEQFLLPTHLEELQYSINIVYGNLANSKWLQDFKKSGGSTVIEELFLTLINTEQQLSEKIRINLIKILLRILEHQGEKKKPNLERQAQGQKQIQGLDLPQKQDTNENYEKISQKIMQYLQTQRKRNSLAKPSNYIECLNLMMKLLIILSTKKSSPDVQVLLKFFFHDQILITIADLILFQCKDNDTTFFMEDILEKSIFHLQLSKCQKNQIFNQFVQRYLNFSCLLSKRSTQNYFIFIVDYLQNISQSEPSVYQQCPKVIDKISDYVNSTFFPAQHERNQIENSEMLENLNEQESMPTQEMIYGCIKLFNETYSLPAFQYNKEKIFNVLLSQFILCEGERKIKSNEKENSMKQRIKYKKSLYEIIKVMIYNNQGLLNIFIDKIVPKLQSADWRRSLYTFWNLQHHKKEKRFFCGLENLAATCYINCLFQQIFMTKRFTDRFIAIDSLAYKQVPENNQIYQLQKLFTYLKFGNKRSYTTRPFCESFITYEGVPIDPSVQNDADEFFNALMDKIQSFLKASGNHEILQQTFEGKLSNQLNCEGCPHSSQKIDSFLSIGIDIKNKKTLEAALDGYVEGQILDGDNAYYCEKCQKKVRTMKRLCIKEVPNILVIVLKRFSYNYDEMRKIKINDELKFSQNLNIKRYTSQYNLNQQCKPDQYYDYRLRGVVIHSGTSQAGHYYSFIKNETKQNESRWYEFNDEHIEQASYKRIQQQSFGGEEKDSEMRMEKHKNAYILFYEKNLRKQSNIPFQNIEKQGSNSMTFNINDAQSFESQLIEVVKSQNRNSDFLSIILDQSFISLCESISVSDHICAHKFLMLYFHTVLVRDRNKQQYLSNIYRQLISLMSGNFKLCLWYIEQINQDFIQQFLIEAPRLVKYLILGLVLSAVKLLVNGNKGKRKEARDTLQKKEKQSETSSVLNKKPNPEAIIRPDIENERNESQSQLQYQSNQDQDLNQRISKKQVQSLEKINENQLEDLQRYSQQIKKLIKYLVCSLRQRGMTPLSKIFVYLSSIPEYREQLQKYEYPDRVCQIIFSDKSTIHKKIECQNKVSYFGQQKTQGKQKQLETSYIFLIESLRFYPSKLSKQQILSLMKDSQSRPVIKTLTYLLSKSTQSADEAFENVQVFEEKLSGEKYKRQDVQKYMFLIRYYYLLASKRKSSTENKIQHFEPIKNICLNSLAKVVEQNKQSYLLMNLLIIDLNKIAKLCNDFKNRWVQKVFNSESLYKSLANWIVESKRPVFLQNNEQWKRKVSNISSQQKDDITKQNQYNQQTRTQWMILKRQNKNKKPDGEEIKEIKDDLIPDISSDLENAQSKSNVIVGFKQFKVIDRLGLLTKLSDEKGICKWGILQRNEIETYFDF